MSGAPSAFALADAYTENAPASNGTAAFPFSEWTIRVGAVEEPEKRVKIGRGEKLADVLARLDEKHRLAGPRIAQFLAARSPEEITSELSYLRGLPVEIPSLNGEVSVKLLAVGWQKYVYRADFLPGDSSQEPVSVILKLPKFSWDRYAAEIVQLETLAAKGVSFVPRLGSVIAEDDAVPAYLEEFVRGESVREKRRRNEVSDGDRRAIVRSLLTIYRQTGSLPEGIRPKQLLLRKNDEGADEAVLVDLGGEACSSPGALLDHLDVWYGVHGKGRSSRVSATEWWTLTGELSRPRGQVRDKMIFETLLEVFGEKEGRELLEKARAEWRSLPAAPWFRFAKEDFEDYLAGNSVAQRAANRAIRFARRSLWQFERQLEFYNFRRDLENFLIQ